MKGGRLKLLVFESHPVHYRAPVYRELQRLCPGQFKVVYGTDQSLRGWTDSGFGHALAWDEPLLEGYPNQVLGNAVPEGLKGFSSLSGAGVVQQLREAQPRAVLLTQFRYAFDWTAFATARASGVPVWIRQETQDEAFVRSRLKGVMRAWYYRCLYSQVAHGFFIGERNMAHLLKHGIPRSRLSRAPYATVDRFKGAGAGELEERRRNTRKALGLAPEQWVVAFSGKFIEKKSPALVLNAVERLAQRSALKLAVMLIGSGEQEAMLRARAQSLVARGIPVLFPGFVNQSQIGDYYLAADAMVLPSQRMGETWGLVVNEALQAGCGVVMSEAVGCAAEFGGWERVRTVPVGCAKSFEIALAELAQYPRSFDWCRPQIESYSIETAAEALAARMGEVDSQMVC
jgi:glycosyltransferase involved in cell wall biosynthesis